METDPNALSDGLATMSRFFVGDATVHETLTRVAEIACQAVAPADMVGLTMLADGRPSTAVFTDEAVPEIDTAQYSTGVGPCLDAFRHLQVYRIDDMADDRQWVPFSEAAAAAGVRSSMSLPLAARHEGVGALNFYSRTRAFSDDDVQVGLQLATHAAIVLANSQAYWDAFQLSQNLTAAMSSRAVIEQAKGIIMGTRHCSADEAFEILVRASQRENRKLREVAQQIVAKTAAGPVSAPAPPSPAAEAGRDTARRVANTTSDPSSPAGAR